MKATGVEKGGERKANTAALWTFLAATDGTQDDTRLGEV